MVTYLIEGGELRVQRMNNVGAHPEPSTRKSLLQQLGSRRDLFPSREEHKDRTGNSEEEVGYKSAR